MQIEKSVVLTQAELLEILTRAVPQDLKVIGIEFFYDEGQKVRLIVTEKTQKEGA